jgi:ppGpp synthetase/RelA/SpoT-type nucleotidyltranferase
VTLDQDRDWYASVRDDYESVAENVRTVVEILAAERGIHAETHCRAKTVDSFVKKAIVRRYSDPRTETTDLAGVRITLISRTQRDELVDALVAQYPDAVIERKNPSLQELGYSGVHVTLDHPDASGTSRTCEIQLRTAGEDAWNRISHELLYKPGLELDVPVTRALYLLQALAELIDNEAERGLETLVTHPLYPASRLLLLAEREYLPLAGRDYYRPLSLEVLDAVKDLVGDLDAYEPVLAAFAAANKNKLARVLANYRGDGLHAILGQPEAIVLFQLAETDDLALEHAWSSVFDPELLEPVLDVWGPDV